MDASRPDCAPAPEKYWLDPLPGDPTPTNQAIYVPSVSPNYAKDAYTQQFGRPLAANLAPNVFNFLDPVNRDLFYTAHAMSSAGQAIDQKGDCIITQRDKKRTRIIGDSGGYQIAGGMEIADDAARLKTLRWLEKTADIAMTLDVPTANARFKNSGYRYATTQACLNATLEHLKFFAANRDPASKVHFLNVLQGNNPDQADNWYDAVKVYDFEGWAFAGLLRKDMYRFCRRIIIMAREGQLQRKSWIHVLGTNELDTAVMLSAVQQAINESGINPYLRISFDTSTPFRNLRSNSIFTTPSITHSEMLLHSTKAPADPAFFDSKLPWPWPSPIGKRLTLGDFCVKGSVANRTFHDRLSNHYQVHHNLSVLCEAISTANKVFDVDRLNPQPTVHTEVREAIKVMRDVIATQDLDALKRNRAKFEALRNYQKKTPNEYSVIDDGEEERCWVKP